MNSISMNKYDIHTHILPGIDDGSPDVDISLILIEELEKQGVSHIALTPHFYTQFFDMSTGFSKNGTTVKEYLDTRDMCLNSLKAEYTGKIKFILGCELHMSENILKAKDLTPFCYQNTNYLLAEMPYNSTFPNDQIEWLRILIKHFDVVPVLAHIERYPVLIKNKALLEQLIDMGCMVQINTQSLYTMFLGKKIVKMINSGYIHFLGSDTHSTMRGCDFAQGYAIIKKHCTEDKIKLFSLNSKKIFGE
ncbi:MAG: CpsB/CapC family capsule biosynthesis tyrosine phosphatase [Acutalibacteraceae bacterium]|nr:CpsB/CapC family capsule biosynthesis tyrosine phosphatase [Acutalibacteraceae bacterium]